MAGSRTLRLLEIALFVVVLGAGTVIKFTGPRGSRRYTRPVNGNVIELQVPVTLGTGNENVWTADLLSVGDRPAQTGIPLQVSFDVPGGPTC